MRRFPVVSDEGGSSEIAYLVRQLLKVPEIAKCKRDILLARIDEEVRLLYLGHN